MSERVEGARIEGDDDFSPKKGMLYSLGGGMAAGGVLTVGAWGLQALGAAFVATEFTGFSAAAVAAEIGSFVGVVGSAVVAGTVGSFLSKKTAKNKGDIAPEVRTQSKAAGVVVGAACGFALMAAGACVGQNVGAKWTDTQNQPEGDKNTSLVVPFGGASAARVLPQAGIQVLEIQKEFDAANRANIKTSSYRFSEPVHSVAGQGVMARESRQLTF